MKCISKPHMTTYVHRYTDKGGWDEPQRLVKARQLGNITYLLRTSCCSVIDSVLAYQPILLVHAYIDLCTGSSLVLVISSHKIPKDQMIRGPEGCRLLLGM